MSVVEIRGLHKWFGRVHAVNDLTLSIGAGEIFGVLGHNGAGKTTAFNVLMGFYEPTEGQAAIFDRPPGDPAVLSRVGFLPEVFSTYDFLTVDETLDLYGRLFSLPAPKLKERKERLLSAMDLDEHRTKRVGQLSKGLLRRLGVAQALINDPDVLVLDEPTYGLDPVAAKRVKDLLKQERDRGKTILTSSHILSEVELICDRIVIMKNGVRVKEGRVQELLQTQDRFHIWFSGGTAETMARLKALALALDPDSGAQQLVVDESKKREALGILTADESVDIRRSDVERISLEDVYVKTFEGASTTP